MSYIDELLKSLYVMAAMVEARDPYTGDHVYCRSCGGQAEVERDGGAVRVKSTGRKGSIEDLQPEADMDLIGALIRETARHVKAKAPRSGLARLFRWGDQAQAA